MRWSLLATACLLWAGTLQAEPRPVERVVARVDGSPILLSTLMRASRPRLAQLGDEPAWQRARALRLALDAAREDAIAAALLTQHAQRLRFSVAESEIDAVVARIAADRKVGVGELLAEAHAAGFPAPAYRAELRRQLLEQRLLMGEPHGAAGAPPSGAALGAWLERRRNLLLSELRRRACIERFGRF